MESIDSFKKPDGQYDWPAYNEARKLEDEALKAKGQLCSQCGSYIVWSKGYPQRCHDCKALDQREELRHPCSVRCPKCGNNWNVGDNDDYDLFEEGEHEVNCGECGHDFSIGTSVSYTFTSPERISEGDADKKSADEA